MKLRDGNYYMPFESQHMILRDGKSVHALQASIFNNLLRKGPFRWNTGEYTSYERELSGAGGDYVDSYREQNRWKCNPFRSYSDIKQQSLTDLRPDKCQSSSPVVTKRRQTSPAIGEFYSKRGGSREAMQLADGKHIELPQETPLYLWKARCVQSLSFVAFFVMIAVRYFVRLTDSLIKAEKQIGKFLKFFGRACVRCAAQIQRLVIQLLTKIKRKKSFYNIRKASTQIDLRKGKSVYGLRTLYKSLNLLMLLFPIIVAVMLFGSFVYQQQQGETDEINIAEWNLPNSDKLIISATANVSLWHVAPEPRSDSHTPIEILNDGHPIIFYLRDHDELVMNIEHRINVLKSLSDTGYHVIIPIQRVTVDVFQSVWWTIRKKLKHKQSMYVWSDVRDVDGTKFYTDGLSGLGMIPAGVVIETKAKENLKSSARSLEIWKGGESKTGDVWNYLKCPLSSSFSTKVLSNEEQPNSMQRDIGLCLTTISFDADFKVRY